MTHNLTTLVSGGDGPTDESQSLSQQELSIFLRGETVAKKVDVDVIILWKNERWEERNVTMQMPGGSTEEDVREAAVKATMSNLAALGKLDDVKTMGVITGDMAIEMKKSEEKEKDAITR